MKLLLGKYPLIYAFAYICPSLHAYITMLNAAIVIVVAKEFSQKVLFNVCK